MVFSNPYDYKPVERYTVLPAAGNPRYRKLAVSFPSACATESPRMNDVSGVCYLPQKAVKPPLVVLAHGVGDTSATPCHLLAGALADNGIASFVLYMPVHSRRLPEEMKARFYRLSIQEWLDFYRVSVVNIRQVLDWAETRPELDADRMGVAGISFGGYVSAIALGVDSRLKSGAILLACGNQEKLAWTSTTRRFGKWDVSEEYYTEAQKNYLSYVDDVASRGFDNVPPLRPSYPFDPYTFSSTIKDKQVLMVNAKWDAYFPREAALDFWQACGRPKQVWLPAGHASAWLYYPIIRRHVVELFRESFMAKSER